MKYDHAQRGSGAVSDDVIVPKFMHTCMHACLRACSEVLPRADIDTVFPT